MIVHIKNVEPCWVEYGFSVEIPDHVPEQDAREWALAHEGRWTMTYGPEVQGQIDGMDQEFKVTEIQR